MEANYRVERTALSIVDKEVMVYNYSKLYFEMPVNNRNDYDLKDYNLVGIWKVKQLN